MALLTAEDVLNKAFSKTKYREGFDQDEVDDFLDEVAAAISSLTEERDRLAAQVRELEAGGGASRSRDRDRDRDREVERERSAQTFLEASTSPAETPASMLSMAQKLHDEYVRSGEEAKEKLLIEARAEAERVRSKADREARESIVQLAEERRDLERKIDDLRRFERDYRQRLTHYLENLLGDLDHGAGKDRMPNTAPEI